MTGKTPHLDSLQQNGYVIIRNLINAEQVNELREASQNITDLARLGQWPYVRTVPKQYPPWPANKPGTNIWGVQHLLHPNMPNRGVFAALYFSDLVLDVVKELICTRPSSLEAQCVGENSAGETANGTGDGSNEEADRLVMELFNLLVSPSFADSDSQSDSQSASSKSSLSSSGSSPRNPMADKFQLTWHRDDINLSTTTPEQETHQLSTKSPQGRQVHAQYNIALTDNDTSLLVIPGSHLRCRTPTEYELLAQNPYADHLPNQTMVELNAGDAVFYDSNILHRGVYTSPSDTAAKDSATSPSTSPTISQIQDARPGKIEQNQSQQQQQGRLTLHGSVGLAGHGHDRARQVLQHGIGEWIDDEPEDDSKPDTKTKAIIFNGSDFSFGLTGQAARNAARMRRNLIAIGKGEGLGYSLDG